MPSLLKSFFLFALAALPVLAQPSIGGIVNAASYAKAQQGTSGPIGNNLIAQGAIFTVFGKNLGPATLVSSSSLPLVTSLPDANGTSVSIVSGGQTVSAFMVYTSAGQVSAILPSNTPIGAATVTLTYAGQTSAPAMINVVQSGLGVFTQNSQGNGPAIAQLFHGGQAPGLNMLTNSVQTGDTLVLYGTGLGAISGADNAAPGAVPAGSNVTVNIAGTTIAPTYAGRSPNFPGLDQINFQLPANLPTGCYIPAEITAGSQPSNLFYLSIAANSTTCTHPFGLSADALAKLDAGGSINIGHFLLAELFLTIPVDGAGGLFASANANSVFQMYRTIDLAYGAQSFPVATGKCGVMDTSVGYVAPSVPNLSQIGAKELDPGPAVTVTGTGTIGVQGILHDPVNGGFATAFISVLGTGLASVTGTGGADVGAFTATATLPDQLVWTNSGNLANPPRADLTITWTGGKASPQSLVTIFGSSVVTNPTDPSKDRGKQFFCSAPASAGSFVVPASIVQQLPSSIVSGGEVAVSALGITSGGGTTFTAPLTSGTLDSATIVYGLGYAQTVKYQ